jgi:hexosaminidase
MVSGGKNFRDGNWLGFEEDDIELIIDFGRKKSVNKITIGLLQDINSWIFLPVSIEFAGSDDGITFNQIGHLTEQEIKQSVNGPIWDISKTFVAQKAQYLKIHIENRESCPPGHPGAGGKAWLFVDEIMIE